VKKTEGGRWIIAQSGEGEGRGGSKYWGFLARRERNVARRREVDQNDSKFALLQGESHGAVGNGRPLTLPMKKKPRYDKKNVEEFGKEARGRGKGEVLM